jgi:type III pantothenate kinase
VTPDVAVDIGNTRLKWGVCRDGRVTEVHRLPLDDRARWDKEFVALATPGVCRWAVASVNPPAARRFVAWARKHGDAAVFEDRTLIPLRISVDFPEKVGLDRLFGAVAAKAMVPAGTPAVTVDVGTAATVNFIDADGSFQGGAILPAARLMARALNEFTAKLPLSEPTAPDDGPMPGKNTAAAIRAGILAALNGGVVQLTTELVAQSAVPPWVFLTGGGARLLDADRIARITTTKSVPALVLEGIRIAAEALS